MEEGACEYHHLEKIPGQCPMQDERNKWEFSICDSTFYIDIFTNPCNDYFVEPTDPTQRRIKHDDATRKY